MPPKPLAETVDAYLQKLDAPLAEMVEALRQVILDADPQVGEQVKWNSPSFYYTGEMQPFDPKEYKRDIVVMNLHKGYPLLVFPTGAKVSDASGLLEGNFKDGRKMATFRDLDAIEARKEDLQQVIRAWISLVE